MTPEPQAEHKWLQRLVGEWTMEAEAIEPGKPPFKAQGTESVRSLGGLWIIAEGEGEMPGGGTGRNVMTLGYDPAQQRVAGTWIGSMMTHMWVYDGELDQAANVLTLKAEGPAMTAEGGTAHYKDVIELVDDDHRTLTSHVLGEDGEWTQFMTARYTRTTSG
jgi:hypothetical protein